MSFHCSAAEVDSAPWVDDRQMKMKQQTLAIAADQGEGFEQYRKPTQRDAFLEKLMENMAGQLPCYTGQPHAGNPFSRIDWRTAPDKRTLCTS